jgi:hypothetical protein
VLNGGEKELDGEERERAYKKAVCETGFSERFHELPDFAGLL